MNWIFIDSVLFIMCVFILGRHSIRHPPLDKYEKEIENTYDLLQKMSPRKRVELIEGYIMTIGGSYLVIKYLFFVLP